MNWYKRQLKIAMPAKRIWTEEELSMIKELIEEGNSFRQIAPLFNTDHNAISRLPGMRQLFEDAKKKKIEKRLKEIKKLTDHGYSIQQISDISGIDINAVKKMIKEYNIPKNFNQPAKVPIEKLEEAKRLYTKEDLNIAAISRLTGINYSTILDFLKREGVYNKQREISPPFNPSQEEISKIDRWYALPPEGEGRSINWISKQLGVGDANVILRWFRKTGRPIRSREEQVGTQSTRDDMAIAQLLLWEQRGGMKGYLLSMGSREQAIKNLKNFVHKVMFNEKNVGHGMAIRNKYMQIINDHTYPDEVQQEQQPVIASGNWYKIAQINGGEVKYGPDGSFFILGKNTKPNEGPWRISYFDENGRGWTHRDFKTYEDAKAVFNYTWGTKDPPKEGEHGLAKDYSVYPKEGDYGLAKNYTV